MTELYYQDLRKRLEKMEDKWLWAYPRIFGWVDSKGAVTILHENPQVAIYRKEEEFHAAEMARLEAELDAIEANRAQTAAEPKPAQQMSRAREQAVVTPAPNTAKPSPVRERGVGTPKPLTASSGPTPAPPPAAFAPDKPRPWLPCHDAIGRRSVDWSPHSPGRRAA